MRAINKVIMKTHYPTPTIETSRSCEAKWFKSFTKLGMTLAFNYVLQS